MFDRSSEARLRISGADRASWLQGLVTNDVVSIAPGQGCYAAYLTAQGRMITDLRILARPDHFLIDLPASTAGTVQGRFEMFVITEDVQIENVSDALCRIALHGPAATAMLGRALAPFVPAAEHEGDSPLATRDALAARLGALEEHSSLEVLGRTGSLREPSIASPAVDLIVAGTRELGRTGFDLYAPASEAAWLRDVLHAAGAVEGDAAVWNVLRLEAGTPVFGVDMDEDTIPLEAGIEQRAISFTKGCYVGQEIIVRVMHRGRGRVARRLVRLIPAPDAATASIPSAGDALTSGDGKREIGRITSAAFSPGFGHAIALGYVQRDFAAPGTPVVVQSRDLQLNYQVIEDNATA